jgi:hypothetical protein
MNNEPEGQTTTFFSSDWLSPGRQPNFKNKKSQLLDFLYVVEVHFDGLT